MTPAMRNKVGGVMVGLGLGFALGVSVAHLSWDFPRSPDPARGLVHAFTTKSGVVIYQSAFSHYFLMPTVFAGILLSNLGWLVTPRERRGGANPYDRDDKDWKKIVPVEYAPGSYAIGGVIGLAAAYAVHLIFKPY